jgi:N utilization substance protein B
LISALSQNLAEIDSTLADAAENWDVERMSIIDRNILRIAIAELRYVEDVPWKVAIDEAVTLASRYGGADSPRFVNGVLDALAHKLNLIAT